MRPRGLPVDHGPHGVDPRPPQPWGARTFRGEMSPRRARCGLRSAQPGWRCAGLSNSPSSSSPAPPAPRPHPSPLGCGFGTDLDHVAVVIVVKRAARIPGGAAARTCNPRFWEPVLPIAPRPWAAAENVADRCDTVAIRRRRCMCLFSSSVPVQLQATCWCAPTPSTRARRCGLGRTPRAPSGRGQAGRPDRGAGGCQ